MTARGPALGALLSLVLALLPARPALPAPSKEFEAVEKALRQGQWVEARRRADALLARGAPPEERINLLYASALGSCYSRLFVCCLVRTDQIRREIPEGLSGIPVWRTFHWQVRVLRAEALIGLRREEEAGRILAGLREEDPTLEGIDRARTLESALRASGAITHDLAYDGRYRDHPQLARAMESAPESLSKAMERVRWWLAEPGLGFPPLVLRLEDDDWKESGAAAWATRVYRGEELLGVMTFAMDDLVHGAYRDRGILAHELGHVLRFQGSGGAMEANWFEEGFAHWISADLDSELPELVLAWRVCPAHFHPGGRDDVFPPRPIPATEEEVAAREPDEQRLCGVLFFEHIERRFGLKTMRKLAADLLRAPDPRPALAQHLRKTPDEIFAAVAADFAALQERAWYVYPDLEAIRSSLHARSWPEAERLCVEFCRKWTASKLRPVVERGLFAALRGQGKAEEARRVLDRAIADHRDSVVHPWLLLESLRLAREAGDRDRVIALGEEIRGERSMLDDAARAEVKAAVEAASAAPPSK